jgi:hypothetical protein
MIELTPLEQFQIRLTVRRESLLRAIRRKKQRIKMSARLMIARQGLAEDMAALKEAQQISPRNEQLRKMVGKPLPSASAYVGDESWD